VARGAKKMGRKRPHPNTTVWLARSGRAQNSQIDLFFEVPWALAAEKQNGAKRRDPRANWGRDHHTTGRRSLEPLTTL